MRLMMDNVGSFSGVDEQGRPFRVDNIARLELVVGTTAEWSPAPPPITTDSPLGHHGGHHGGHHPAEREVTTAQSQSLSLSVDSDSDSPLVPSSPPVQEWWERRPDFEVVHRKFRWTREPRGPTLHLLDLMARHPMTGPDEEAGQRWVATALESLNRTKSKKVVEYVYDHRFKPLLDEEPSQSTPAAPDPVIRGGELRPVGASIRDAVLATYRQLVESGEASEFQRREYDRLQQQAQGP